MPKIASHPSIILFDGVCVLCMSSVRFIVKRDRKERFRFGALQSDEGQQALAARGLPPADLDSFVLVANGRAYRKSTAALMVLRYLKAPWPLLYGLIVVPRVLRDPVYDFIGRRRYRWFGRHDVCWVPRPEERGRFL